MRHTVTTWINNNPSIMWSAVGLSLCLEARSLTPSQDGGGGHLHILMVTSDLCVLPHRAKGVGCRRGLSCS